MSGVTTKIRIGAFVLAIVFAAAAARPVRASESGNAVQQTRAEQETAEPDPSIPLRITAIDFGWEAR